jgi:hypothetical protein
MARICAAFQSNSASRHWPAYCGSSAAASCLMLIMNVTAQQSLSTPARSAARASCQSGSAHHTFLGTVGEGKRVVIGESFRLSRISARQAACNQSRENPSANAKLKAAAWFESAVAGAISEHYRPGGQQAQSQAPRTATFLSLVISHQQFVAAAMPLLAQPRVPRVP